MKQEYYKKAKKKVKKKKKFKEHLQAYLTTIGILFMLCLFISPMRRVWPMVAFFWGIGLFVDYVKAYGFPGMEEEEDWEEKEIEREVRRMEAKDRWQNRPPEKTDYDDDGLDIDRHLDLNSPRPMPRKKYRDEDLV